MSNWLHAVDGNFNNKHAWGPHMVPGKADDAILNASGAAFTVTSTSNQDVNSLQTSANATLYMQGSAKHAQTFTVEDGTAAGVNAGTIKVGDNVTLQLLGKNFKAETYVVNSGVISLNAKTDNSFLEVQTYDLSGGGTVQLSGGGSILMSDSAFNGIVDTGVAKYESARFINIDNTISGAGVIGDGGLINGVLLDFQNSTAGVINATGTNNALIVNAPSPGAFTSVYNEGLMEATGKAGLNIAASIVDNATGTIFAGNGSIVRLESATIEGGTFNTAGTGVVLVSGGSTIDGATFGAVTNAGVLQDFGEAMYVRGAITNSGSIRFSDETTGAIMKVDVGVSLSGGGTVTLTDNFQNGIQGAGSADSALYNVDNTIAGAGTLGGGRLSLINEAKGVIDATGTYNSLRLYGPGRTFYNNGLMEATGAGGLDVAAITLNQSGGGTLSSGAGSIVRLESASVVGGTLTNAAAGQVVASGGSSLSGTTVVNQGLFSVVEADTLSASGSIANSGTISLAGTSTGSHVLATGALTLSGGGKVLLGNGGSIDSAAAGDTVTNVDNLITGDGELGGGATKLVNAAGGVIAETGTGGLLIDAVKLTNGGLIQASGAGDISVTSAVANSGMIRADTGSMISLTAAVTNTGVLEANGGTLIAYQNVTGAGSATITGGTLEFNKSFNEAVAFTGKSGTLDLARSQSYTASITGFSASGGESLDLGDIKFVSAGEATFSGTSTGGTLTVTDGTHTAHIALTGNYLGSSFHAAKDGAGGVLISATTPSPNAFVAAMAGLGGSAGAAIQSANDHAGATPALLALPSAAAA